MKLKYLYSNCFYHPCIFIPQSSWQPHLLCFHFVVRVCPSTYSYVAHYRIFTQHKASNITDNISSIKGGVALVVPHTYYISTSYVRSILFQLWRPNLAACAYTYRGGKRREGTGYVTVVCLLFPRTHSHLGYDEYDSKRGK